MHLLFKQNFVPMIGIEMPCSGRRNPDSADFSMKTKRNCDLPLICLVCGDTARGINFNLMSCMSCKTFFRRHATKRNLQLQCLRQRNCQINLRTRGACTACRLEKCLQLGMDPKLIGNRPTNPGKLKLAVYWKALGKKTEQPLPQPCRLDLLQNDRSTLSVNEWNLLSNIIHNYDATNIIPHTKYRLEQQLLLPPKVRLRPSTTMDIIKHFYSTVQVLVERVPAYHLLPLDARQDLVHHNSEVVGTLNSMFVLRETNAFDSPAFRTGCDLIYPPDTGETFRKFSAQLASDGALVRLSLLVLAFSPSCRTVSFEPSAGSQQAECRSITILRMQNGLVVVFWKYLLHRFGSAGAVRWFMALIRLVVHLIGTMAEQQNKQHTDMMDTVIDDVTRILTIECDGAR